MCLQTRKWIPTHSANRSYTRWSFSCLSKRREARPPPEIVKQKKAAYREDLPAPDSDWPAAVQLIYSAAVTRLFEEGITAKEIVEDCGFRDHNVYTRFRYEVGCGIKKFIVAHRMELAKRLLRYEDFSVAEIAYAVGYSSPSGFCTTFKRTEGCTPAVFRITSLILLKRPSPVSAIKMVTALR